MMTDDRRSADPQDGLAVFLRVSWRVSWVIPLLGLVLMAASCGNGDSEPLQAAAPCGDGPHSPPPTDNVFANPGFEEGSDPWCYLKPPPFILSDDVAHSGNASVRLPLQADKSEEGNKIAYLVQEIKPETWPEVLSGNYRVENWNRGTEKQYLQFVVIVFGADNLPGGFNNHQIRYLLAGIGSPPFAIANAHFVFVSREDPAIDEWVPFERNVAEDFESLWGAVPQDFEYIRVLFEVRYDDKAVGEGPLGADVYYDDLYFGPAPGP